MSPQELPAGCRGWARTGAAIDAGGWLHTGDTAELDTDGHLKIVDRK
ncbi:hypothetical protein [Trebonia sp.]|nr:hypothetical protein [Trebonia sp.]